MGYKIDYGKYLELQKKMEKLMTQMLEDMAVLEDIERYLWGSKAIQSNAIDAINAYISDKHLETAIPAIESAFTNFYVVENAYFLEMYNIEEKSDSVIEEEHLKNLEDELTRLKTEVSTFIQNMNAEVNAVSHIVNLETKSETDFQDSVDNLISISRKLREDFATYEKNKLLEARGIEWVIDASIMAIDECNGSSYTMKNYTPEADIELETPEYITRASTFYNAHQYTDERLDNVLDKKTTQAAKDEDIDTTMLNNVVENGYVNKIRQEVDETEISSDVDSDMDFHNDSDIIEPSMAEDIEDVGEGDTQSPWWHKGYVDDLSDSQIILGVMKSEKGMSTLGSSTRENVISAGKAWVGDNYNNIFDGKGNLIGYSSADGMRAFRIQFKPKENMWRANFQENMMVNNPYPNPGQHSSILKNVHIDIIE